ncbi:MAG: DUF2157 domain-containing protein [Inquilinus sp.]|nr:DUF2157 domain-containing protein [Inquilinus sp.]
MTDLADLGILRRAGLLPAGRYLDAVWLVRDHRFWAVWAARALLALGVVHLLAGIVFFFAYNWADMPPVSKFATVQTGIVLAVAGAWAAGLDRPAGQAFLTGATVLLGVLLAVIGQVYQTGADAFELFLAWTLLALPWALASRSAAHWLVWVTIAATAAGLTSHQAWVPMGWLESDDAALPVGLVLAAALVGREAAAGRGARWLRPAWTRQILAFAALAALFLGGIGYVLDFSDGVLSTAVFLIVAAGASVWFWRLAPDFAALAQVLFFAALPVMAAGFRLIGEAAGDPWDSEAELLATTLLWAGWFILVTGALGVALRRLRRRTAGAA